MYEPKPDPDGTPIRAQRWDFPDDTTATQWVNAQEEHDRGYRWPDPDLGQIEVVALPSTIIDMDRFDSDITHLRMVLNDLVGTGIEWRIVSSRHPDVANIDDHLDSDELVDAVTDRYRDWDPEIVTWVQVSVDGDIRARPWWQG